MKFISLVFILLLGVFLVSCTAKGISTKELERLAEQYGGVYVFDKKLEKEINEREALRKEMIKGLKGRDLGDGLYAVDTSPVNEKFPQTLSNGKKYYTIWTEYENETGKKTKISNKYTSKIINFIGKDNYKKTGASLDMSYFYIDSNDEIVPIRMSLNFYVVSKSFGLFGDEGQGIKFSKERFNNISGDNFFYYNGETFIK
ncbi:MAG: tRNA 2-selenouridine synthase, partial [Campylobacter sp.]|nr:tRNA 2-selenouridine synthase [Campylobacter sp.]